MKHISLFIIFLLTIGCSIINLPNNQNSDLIINNLYIINNEQYNSIYIKQNDDYIQYLILTNNYNGDCLLLRKYILDEPMIYNHENKTNKSYYENSYIDLYLNNEFFDKFSDTLKKQIVETNITITTKDSLGIGGNTTMNIKRKIFILSYTEVCGIESSSRPTEGKALNYFNTNESRIAKNEQNNIDSWWLRTPVTGSSLVVCAIGNNGIIGHSAILDYKGEVVNGVRPAFCLPRDTPISVGEVNGEKAYFIADE